MKINFQSPVIAGNYTIVLITSKLRNVQKGELKDVEKNIFVNINSFLMTNVLIPLETFANENSLSYEQL